VNFFLKVLNAKKRHEIRRGKLWEITRVWGLDVHTVEREPAKPLAVIRSAPEGKMDTIQVHIIKGEDNVTNLTKNPELL
jgi:hypothetical protein